MARHKPKWATPDRQAHLVKLFLQSGGFCVFGHEPCPYPDKHHYEPFTEGVIEWWKSEDREQRQAEVKAEQRALHHLGERGRPLCQFNAEAFYEQQPLYYNEGIGISGLTFRPFAKVRLASSYVCLLVDLGDTLRSVSKTKRRKAIRYGKPLPSEVQRKVDHLCSLAVKAHQG